MQTHVYANGLEIAAKAVGSDGSSAQAFPDPCWSPPAPSAGPIVIPYPNTCYAGTITNGTKTVFIGGQQVAIEDHSYFSTSIGNEPATHAFNKGVKTGVITGKAHFAQWSFNVVFEGYGVPRHTDLVSHNHGSMPSNTPLFPYLSRGWFSHDCEKEQKRIDRACQPEKEHSESKREIKKHSKLGSLLKSKGRKKSDKGRRDKSGWHWTDDHCDGLHIPLDSLEKAREYAQEMEEAYKHITEEFNLLNALESELNSMALKAGGKAAAKWGAKLAAKQVAGSSVPAIGNAAMALWSVYDAAVAIGDVTEIKAVAEETLEKLDILREKLTDLQNTAKEFADFSKLSPEEQLKKAQQLGAGGQDILATLNDCMRARKCNLVPFMADGVGNPFGKRDAKNPSKVESSKNGGCCPGQTGHHLIPEASIKDVCPSYDHDAAPTVCVEGTSQNMGSHKRIHQGLAKIHSRMNKNRQISPDGTMSLDQAIDAAAESHTEAFRLSRCSKKCIRVQLDSYYRACRGARPSMVDAQSHKTTPDAGGKSR